ncbi:Eukaryotic translation initiation factor 4 gamma [Grifola frondosa]|uniref:Eukaryotic translation initiation factor 4 gamma n=1 Tax=Grifola frondosa TaxID=5627 RepID=A0A1C7LZJ5_GRIFR|nr:Eukaryotic translation initiation factor 4 gamma [Grifola frondosa]
MFSSKLKTSASMSQVPVTNEEDAIKKAMLAVVQVWVDRLQSITVVTTFFTSVDGLLFSLSSSTRPTDVHAWTRTDKLTNASLGGALIFHVCAAIIAYMGSYVLIRYRLGDATKHESSVESRRPSSVGPAEKLRTMDTRRPSGSLDATLTPQSPIPFPLDFVETLTDLRGLITIHQVRPLGFLSFAVRTPMGKHDGERQVRDDAIAALQSLVRLLSRCHTLSVVMSMLGFVLALLGILTASTLAAYAYTPLNILHHIFSLGDFIRVRAAVIYLIEHQGVIMEVKRTDAVLDSESETKQGQMMVGLSKISRSPTFNLSADDAAEEEPKNEVPNMVPLRVDIGVHPEITNRHLRPLDITVIEDLGSITYPAGIKRPKVELNVNAKEGQFRYDREFLLQFMAICKEKPNSLPPLDAIGLTSIGLEISKSFNTMGQEVVDRKVRGLLNKLTMESFDSISDQIIALANGSEKERDGRTLIQVIRVVFEQAADEAMRSEMYGRLCRKMMEQISPNVQDDGVRNFVGKPIVGGQLFRKYLRGCCQDDFERWWAAKEATAAAAAMKAMEDQATKAAAEENKNGESVLYSDEYYAARNARRQCLGLIKFIGELFKLQMLTERMMHECVKKLLVNIENPEEEEIKSLCMLLTSVGHILDTPKARAHMDVYFSRMRELSRSPNISHDMQSMLQDPYMKTVST